MLIERGDLIGLRARDPEAPARVHSPGLDYFAYQPAWKLAGRFEPLATPRTLRLADVIGGTQQFRSPGAIVFSQRGAEHRLEGVEEPDVDDYFVIFHERTTGETTYAAGRFLYVARPDSRGG